MNGEEDDLVRRLARLVEGGFPRDAGPLVAALHREAAIEVARAAVAGMGGSAFGPFTKRLEESLATAIAHRRAHTGTYGMVWSTWGQGTLWVPS